MSHICNKFFFFFVIFYYWGFDLIIIYLCDKTETPLKLHKPNVEGSIIAGFPFEALLNVTVICAIKSLVTVGIYS